MEKKTLYIIIAVAVVAVIVIAAVGIAVGSQNNNDNKDKYVTYEGNGGKDSLDNTSYKEYSDTVGETKFFLNNYALTGYNDKVDGSGKSYSKGDHVSYGTTLYAQWAKITDTNVKIVGNSIQYLKIMGEKTDLKIGDNTLSDDNCNNLILFIANDGYTFTTDGSSSFGTYYLKDGTNQTVCTIIASDVSFYTEADNKETGNIVDKDFVIITMAYVKNITITLEYPPA